MVPRPVIAVVLLFPIEKGGGASDELSTPGATGPGVEDEEVFYVRQKIGNACGTIALLHALANNADVLSFEANTFIDTFVRESAKMSADEKAAYLDERAEQGVSPISLLPSGPVRIPGS